MCGPRILHSTVPAKTRFLFRYLETAIHCFLIGLLTVSGAEEAISNTAEKAKTSSDNAGDIVMLEIDVKEPVKRSPITATAEYGAPANQYILQSADDTQEVAIDHFIIHVLSSVSRSITNYEVLLPMFHAYSFNYARYIYA